MSLIISVYTKNAFKEFLLPPLTNADHIITLRRDEFRLKDDLKLKLEVIDQQWKIRSTEKYRVLENDQYCLKQELRDQQIFKIRTAEALPITVRPMPLPMSPA